MDAPALDNPVWSSLTGAHAGIAIGDGDAARYPEDVAPFAGMADPRSERCWKALGEIVGPDPVVVLTDGDVPSGWEVRWRGRGVQMTAGALDPAPDPAAVLLGSDDVAAMLDLVGRTRPGPFRPRTFTLGTYLGIRDEGALVAMAGERMHPQGWTEISAVCTDPAYQGRGLATRLVRALALGIAARGERAMLHVAADNTRAVRLYGLLGFDVRTELSICEVQRDG